MGGKGRLEDEPHPLGDVWNALEGLHPVGDMLCPRCPQTDVDQPRLMEEILQAVEVVGCRGQGAPGSLGDTAMADRRRS